MTEERPDRTITFMTEPTAKELRAKLRRMAELADDLDDIADLYVSATNGTYSAGGRDAHRTIARQIRKILEDE